MPAVALRRVVVGLVQGVLLYLMYKAGEAKAWPATDLAVFETLLPLLFAPLVAIHADSHLSWRRLTGELPARLACEDMLNRLRAGEAKTAAARWQDLEIAGIRMDIAEKTASDRADCPKP